MDILDEAAQMLLEHPLCDHCLGRQFALLGHGAENVYRGGTIKLLLTMRGHRQTLAKDKQGVTLLKTVAAHGSFPMAGNILRRLKKRSPKKKPCFLCGGSFENVDSLVDKIAEKLSEYEFRTFLVGIELPHEMAEREDEFKAHFNVTYGESIKNQFSRDLGKRISCIVGKEVEFKTPDLVVLVNPFTGGFKLQVNPLFIFGRYRKLVRGIPQSRWLCRQCGGKGCESCGWTGRNYTESVEELVGVPIMEAAGGEELALHGSGREDVDARMLGTGRPFVLEVKEPKKRFLDLEKLAQRINDDAKGKVEVRSLRFADKHTVRRLKKAEASVKVYRATVEFSRDVSDEELRKMEKTLSGATVSQQTPHRVLHRRADLMREKYIYEAKVRRLSRSRAELRIRCQGGLYVKELISGDDGRTNPSVASIVGAEAKTTRLDVLSVAAGEEK
jgi:tRNA pseudouridine synthase 10